MKSLGVFCSVRMLYNNSIRFLERSTRHRLKVNMLFEFAGGAWGDVAESYGAMENC